jgi:hypothetical protein
MNTRQLLRLTAALVKLGASNQLESLMDWKPETQILLSRFVASI